MLAHPAIVNEIARTASASVPFVAGDCTIFSRSDKDDSEAIIFFRLLMDKPVRVQGIFTYLEIILPRLCATICPH
jgi:hypothetical protein